ncbi:MAG TPA: 23S rRNA (adenine(2030)-N(6))-methyltransferase RlmJ [Usitatibacteraceae bacterium]
MLSYRHAFHAGNHADVLKHFVLIELQRYLGQKEAPFWVIDTHAGAGLYALDTGYATQLAEYVDGIGRLWKRQDVPPALAEYMDLVRELNPDGQLRAYPGSPWIAQRILRAGDRLRLFELHSTDSKLLQDNFRTLDTKLQRRIIIQLGDGLAGLKALLPPPSRRALVLIDPSYEDKSDYRNIPLVLKDALTRFATGTYAIWYPQLQRADAQRLPAALKALPVKSWLNVSLSVNTPNEDGFGMHGSGMFILNPPWTLHKTLSEVMPWLVDVLGKDAGARFLLEQQAD